MRYIAASLIPPELLKQQCLGNNAKSHSFLQCHNDKVDFVNEIRDIYENSYQQFAAELYNNLEIPSASFGAASPVQQFHMNQALENSFLKLDNHISDEALNYQSTRTMSVAMSGAVACAVHIDGAHLHIANTGDCCAVLGTTTDTGQWQTIKLTNEHNSDNITEVRRILGEHPSNERDTVIRGDRLLSQLAPLRALGDFRYKWSHEILEKHIVPIYGKHTIAPHYYTPPYLTAKPEIIHHFLTPRDRFLVIASDGLWDMLSPMQVVKLIGEHMYGKAFLQPLKLPNRDIKIGEIAQMLQQRK